jgi:GNAT superfamily N-acetyltransferase
MRIVTYDKLRNADGFLQLMESAFWWAAHPDRVAEIRKLDERFRDPYGYALVSGKTVAGFIGTADIPVRTSAGRVEKALGIHHVATHPTQARKGVAARLFEHVEDLYRKRGYRFSFLFTSRSLVAWHLYRKLGYADLPAMEIAPRCHKLFPKAKRQRKLKHPKPNYRLVEKLHAELARGRTGFAARNPGWLKALEKTWKPGPGFVVSCRDGYAIVEDFRGALWIDEFLCRNRRAYLRILERLMLRRPEVLVDCAVWDPVLERIYRERGFKFRRRNYGTLMAKPLGTPSVRSVFGSRFYWTAADQF